MAILWIFIAIVLVSPIAYSYHMSIANGTFDLQIFIEMLIKSITNPFATFGSIFTEGAVGNYFSTLLIVTIFYSLFFFIGFDKTAPKMNIQILNMVLVIGVKEENNIKY